MGRLQYGEHQYGVYSGSLQVFLPWVKFDVKFTLFNRICHPKNLISIERDRCRFMVLFAMPTTVELLQCTSVGGCGCPISSRANQNIIDCLQLRKRAPSSASVAEATTNRKIAQSVNNAPFNLMGFAGSAFHPMKKWPHTRLCAFASERYDASEWTVNIMSEAWNLTVAFGCVAK